MSHLVVVHVHALGLQVVPDLLIQGHNQVVAHTTLQQRLQGQASISQACYLLLPFPVWRRKQLASRAGSVRKSTIG